jgi:hypothetical protein
MLQMICQAIEGPRGNRGCSWEASTTIDGTVHTARSRSGAPQELARRLVAAGIPDQPMQTIGPDGRVQMTYRSLFEQAKWTYGEGNRPLQRVRWKSFQDRS